MKRRRSSTKSQGSDVPEFQEDHKCRTFSVKTQSYECFDCAKPFSTLCRIKLSRLSESQEKYDDSSSPPNGDIISRLKGSQRKDSSSSPGGEQSPSNGSMLSPLKKSQGKYGDSPSPSSPDDDLSSDIVSSPGSNSSAPGSVFSCYTCSIEFPHRNLLMRHVLKSHKRSKNFVCHVCKIAFEHRSLLMRHMKEHRVLKCEFCDLTFGTSEELNIHASAHAQKCVTCGLTFTNSAELKDHELTHTQWKCEKCGQAFNSGSDLRLHSLTHIPIAPTKRFQCTECNKWFTRASTLRVHQHVHSDEKRFSCKFCNRPFKYAKSLTVHIAKVHTNKEPENGTDSPVNDVYTEEKSKVHVQLSDGFNITKSYFTL